MQGCRMEIRAQALLLASVMLVSTGLSEEPRVLDSRLKLELVAEQPEIVTPVGLTFDHEGQLLVIESHTHFPPDDYPGPRVDRIRRLEDTNGDGRADRFTSFLEGTSKTMSLRRGPDPWIYVATRRQVFRTHDSNGDGSADRREIIATLETDGNYPHNGLGGLAFDNQGNLYFGLGENLGESYTLVGNDGTRLSGGGEGGNIYRCRVDGANLEQVATGFWNPFGICVDPIGRVYTVGNDPDASPPCRLVHVVDGGDYGYQFRYGRSGKHPLQAWDGELPGTLPMLAATGEAPSGLLLWHNQIYSTSWGEYRIERFTLQPKGASLTADREIIVQGDNQFRPVDVAISPDGALYFTDWVDRSYNVHGKGRVWRLTWKTEPPREHVLPALNDEAIRARQASHQINWQAMRETDPFLHHAAMMGLVNSRFLSAKAFKERPHAAERLAIIEAARRSSLPSNTRDELLRLAIRDDAPAVRWYAVRWIADDQLTPFREPLEALLRDDRSTVALFRAAMAARDRIGAGKGEALLVEALRSNGHSNLQIMAMKSLPSDHAAVAPSRLVAVIKDAQRPLSVRREAARSLATSEHAEANDARSKLLANSQLTADLQADVRAGMDWSEGDEATQPESRPSELDWWLDNLPEQGDSEAGWRVFFGRGKTACSNCHRLDGRGADIGPDLTGIGKSVDRRKLVESILRPSREIGPRYVPWIVLTSDGRTWTGMSLGVVNNGRAERFLASDGTTFELKLRDIETRQLSPTSIMPAGLHELLTPRNLGDLLAVLSE